MSDEPELDRQPQKITGPDGLVVKIPRLIRVERGRNRVARVWVDGILLALATDSGYHTSTSGHGMPGVTVTLVADRVEVIDDLDLKTPEQRKEHHHEHAAHQQHQQGAPGGPARPDGQGRRDIGGDHDERLGVDPGRARQAGAD